MEQEIKALECNKTWDIVDLPVGKHPICCKWVFKIKHNADGSVERFKARLVAKGFTQQEGIDFHDTFSSVAKMGDLNEEVYMLLPQGFGSKGEFNFSSTATSGILLKNNDPLLKDRSVYHKLVGKLLYLAMTRPDISYAVQTLSQFMHAPKQSHLDAALHVIRYLKGKPGFGITLSSDKDDTITAFCDSDWASCAVTRNSVTGYIV
ncbi:uncharacterized mitochondrial protein AtMg00820-like [Lycium barbarum]|uniref:uncharacterized mitochondrial protein AtMg00820-like n=1 Tax=Lycium barbarum TaxID=112863 RepID=UPI00293EB1A3|nr:uncharacterized mitochondrial protein AtMg00820-like [Lycium barbarum]